ncbi:MAG: hypothetical protein AAGA91_08460 [Pseudomonadota bacterium]
MLDYLIALALFGTAIGGLLTAQSMATRMLTESLQTTEATTLVSGLLDRVAANPGQLSRYRSHALGEAGAHSLPLQNCNQRPCSPADMVAFDLSQWQRNVQLGMPALPMVKPCLEGGPSQLTVAIGWRAPSEAYGMSLDDCRHVLSRGRRVIALVARWPKAS